MTANLFFHNLLIAKGCQTYHFPALILICNTITLSKFNFF